MTDSFHGTTSGERFARLVIWPNANLEALSALVNVPGFRELSQRIDVSHKRTPAVWVCRQKLDRASRRVRVCKGTKYGQFSTENLEGTERNLRLWGGYADQTTRPPRRAILME